jgi:hypothetical protein
MTVCLLTYARELLLSLRRTFVPLTRETLTRVCVYSLRRRRRGRRAGFRLSRPVPSLQPVGNGSYVVIGNRPPPTRQHRVYDVARMVHPVEILRRRHTASTPGCAMIFGSMNVRCLSDWKIDVLLDELRDRHIDVLCLSESWHDSDSVSVRRLRSNGFGVVERARPRSHRADASVNVNHGGVAIVAVPGVRLAAVDVGLQALTFEYVVARVTSGSSSAIVVSLYRPGSSAVTAGFFAEFADLLDRLSTYADPLLLAGDVNIRLERAFKPDTVKFGDILATHGLVQRVDGQTHRDGGTLDVVCVRGDLPQPTVDVVDLGRDFSDHRLLSWASHLYRPPPVYTTSIRRRWRSFDPHVFQVDLRTSVLCDERHYCDLDGDALVRLYDHTIRELLDRQVPLGTFTCRRRVSSLWFDEECRRAKRSVRTSERAARRIDPRSAATSSIVAEWRAQRRSYFHLLRQKRSAFWTSRVDAEQSQPRRLWRSFDELLGRGRVPPVDVDAAVLHRYFDDKVAGVRAATSGADPPTFLKAPSGCAFGSFAPVATDDVADLIRSLPDKQCSLDPLPTWLLKDNASLLSPFLCRLFNWSLG